MFAILAAPSHWHWLVTTGHVLWAIWPYAATLAALALGHFANFVLKEEEKVRASLCDSEARLEALGERLDRHRNGQELQGAWENAREWQARYQLQLQRCEVEHMDRPLPTMPLDAQRRVELDEEMPF